MCFLHLDLIRETYQEEYERYKENTDTLKGVYLFNQRVDLFNFHLNSIIYFHNGLIRDQAKIFLYISRFTSLIKEFIIVHSPLLFVLLFVN